MNIFNDIVHNAAKNVEQTAKAIGALTSTSMSSTPAPVVPVIPQIPVSPVSPAATPAVPAVPAVPGSPGTPAVPATPAIPAVPATTTTPTAEKFYNYSTAHGTHLLGFTRPSYDYPWTYPTYSYPYQMPYWSTYPTYRATIADEKHCTYNMTINYWSFIIVVLVALGLYYFNRK